MLIGGIVLTGLGCTHIISAPLRQQAQPPIAFAELRTNPEAFKGRMVIIGGDILQTTNLPDTTRLEVLQRPLNHSQSPQLTDATGGRFMALCHEYLDPAVYAQQRRVTIAGQVMGAFEGKVGEAVYTYPLISCEEIHVFPSATAELLRLAANPWWPGWSSPYPWRVGAPPFGFWGPYWRYW
jgi:outer membrane lipoprotein